MAKTLFHLLHEQLELLLVVEQSGIDHRCDGCHQHGRNQKEMPVGQHKTQGQQSQQATATDTASIVLLGHGCL